MGIFDRHIVIRHKGEPPTMSEAQVMRLFELLERIALALEGKTQEEPVE